MSELYYREALKRGQKETRTRVSRGQSPCLPVLDDFIPAAKALGGVDLGVVQVPSAFVVGTKSRARENAFAANFMPVMDVKSEFAVKWQRLCQAHLTEGIQEPIKAYEYLNRFYVEEGNKRVSVLKFFDAPQIAARVIRILPERTPENAGYFEFVDFYARSRINEIEFSRPGGYAALQKLLGKDQEAVWTEEESRRLRTVWYYFRTAFDRCGGGKLSLLPGDALLACLEIYGYGALQDKGAEALQQLLKKAWEEIALRQEPEPVEVHMTPPEEKPSLIQKVLPTGAKPIRAAFLHDGSPDSAAWTRGHEQGRIYAQQALQGQVEATAWFDVLSAGAEQAIESAIAAGNTVIFTTSPRLLPASLRAAVEHPEVTFFNCSLNTNHRYIRTYYARMYEVKFIIGAIAGAMAGDDPVGYLADYPIFGQVAGVNAFALGAQMVNPRAKVLLEWSSVGGNEAAEQRLLSRGARLISAQDMTRWGMDDRESLGLSLITESGRVNLATPLWQWGTYYERLLRLVRSSTARQEYAGTSRALNYYWGLSAGVVDLRCAETLPPPVIRLAETLKGAVASGLCRPFAGALYDQQGKALESDGDLTPEQIIRMEELVENITGAIPVYDELTDLAKATVDLVGVGKASRDRRG